MGLREIDSEDVNWMRLESNCRHLLFWWFSTESYNSESLDKPSDYLQCKEDITESGQSIQSVIPVCQSLSLSCCIIFQSIMSVC
jgi:hypothetical protein